MAQITGYRVADDGTMTPLYADDSSQTEAALPPAGDSDPVDYNGMSKKALEDEVKLRNSERKTEDVDYIVVNAPGNKPELIAALVADDQVED